MRKREKLKHSTSSIKGIKNNSWVKWIFIGGLTIASIAIIILVIVDI